MSFFRVPSPVRTAASSSSSPALKTVNEKLASLRKELAETYDALGHSIIFERILSSGVTARSIRERKKLALTESQNKEKQIFEGKKIEMRTMADFHRRWLYAISFQNLLVKYYPEEAERIGLESIEGTITDFNQIPTNDISDVKKMVMGFKKVMIAQGESNIETLSSFLPSMGFGQIGGEGESSDLLIFFDPAYKKVAEKLLANHLESHRTDEEGYLIQNEASLTTYEVGRLLGYRVGDIEEFCREREEKTIAQGDSRFSTEIAKLCAEISIPDSLDDFEGISWKQFVADYPTPFDVKPGCSYKEKQASLTSSQAVATKAVM